MDQSQAAGSENSIAKARSLVNPLRESMKVKNISFRIPFKLNF